MKFALIMAKVGKIPHSPILNLGLSQVVGPWWVLDSPLSLQSMTSQGYPQNDKGTFTTEPAHGG